MTTLDAIMQLEKIENSLGAIAIQTNRKDIKQRIFQARKITHQLICILLEDKEDAPEHPRKK
jgi:hypothetical protein